MDVPELLKIGLPLAIGWFIVHRLSAARDIDKARRDIVAKTADELVVNATEIFITAKRYHASERHLEDEQRLKMDLQDMSIRVHQLIDMVDEPSKLRLCATSIAELRRAITGYHFEDKHVEALDAEVMQIAEIADAYLRLKRALFALKISQYPKR